MTEGRQRPTPCVRFREVSVKRELTVVPPMNSPNFVVVVVVVVVVVFFFGVSHFHPGSSLKHKQNRNHIWNAFHGERRRDQVSVERKWCEHCENRSRVRYQVLCL